MKLEGEISIQVLLGVVLAVTVTIAKLPDILIGEKLSLMAY